MRTRSASVLFALLFGVAMATGLAETASGGVFVATLPAGADVWVDGVYVGHAPLVVDALAPGRHVLTITKTGWEVRDVDVTVAAGAVTMSSTQLVAGPRAFTGSNSGTLVVRGSPPSAILQLDGAAFTPAPSGSNTVAVGPHKLAMTTPRGRTTHAFTVYPQTTTDVVLVEPRASGGRSSVVAPADDYLPTDAFSVEGTKIVLRYNGHVVVAHLGQADVRFDGATVTYGTNPESIAGKLFLPVELLEKLTEDSSKSR
jgi:hypothetical protein